MLFIPCCNMMGYGVFTTIGIESVIFMHIWNKRARSYLTSVTAEKLDFLIYNIENPPFDVSASI